MIYTGYDLPGSLKTCDSLKTGFDRVSCSGGVFMENFTSSYGVTSKYLRKNDPIYPCNAVAERHKLYCYLLVTANILKTTGYDQAKTADACRRSEKAWISTCYESFGRDVSGIAGKSVGKALASCQLAKANQGDCIYGVSREIVNSDAAGARGGRFCARAPARHQHALLRGRRVGARGARRQRAGAARDVPPGQRPPHAGLPARRRPRPRRHVATSGPGRRRALAWTRPCPTTSSRRRPSCCSG